MVDFKRQISCEEAQNIENKNKENGSSPTKNTKWFASRQESVVERPEHVVEMDTLIEEPKQEKIRVNRNVIYVKKRRTCKRCRQTCLSVYLTLLGIAVLTSLLWIVKTEYLQPSQILERPTNTSKHSGNEAPIIAGASRFRFFKNEILPEEYEIDPTRLHNEHVVDWVGQEGNKHVISETAETTDCVRIKESGTYKIFNSVTMAFRNKISIFHAMALKTNNRKDVVKKAHFVWSEPQTGRQPSTLQFLVRVQAGDELCLQTADASLIYAGQQDNVLLIEKMADS